MPDKGETRRIDTGLTGPINHAILDSVMGQLSDGKWENTPAMAKYWRNAKIAEQDGKIVILINDHAWDSGFRGKDDAWIKAWFAGKIKEIVYDEFQGQRWDRKNTSPTDYLSRNYGTNPAVVTVSDAYKAYEILKGRKIGNKYGEPTAAAAPQGAPAQTPPLNPTVQATPESLVNHLIEAGRKAIVTAQAFNRATGEPNGVARDEEVDLDSNQLFKHCKSWLDVKKAYESFWNDLNPDSEDVVMVSNVKMPTATAMDKFVSKHAKAPKFPEPARR